MKRIIIIKNGDGISQFKRLSNDWKDNSIELIWDIKQLTKKYHIILISLTDGIYDSYAYDRNISFYNIGIISKSRIISIYKSLEYILKLVMILAREKADLLIISNFKFLKLILFVSRLLNYNLVLNFSRGEQVTRTTINLIRRYKIRDIIVPGLLIKTFPNLRDVEIHCRIPKYPNSFFSLNQCSDIPTSHFIIAFIGRLVKSKGIYEFIEAAIQIAKVEKKIAFIVLGTGPELSNVEHIIISAGLSSRISLLGEKSNISIGSYLRQVKVLVVPSHTEGFSKTWLEAIFTETPMILTRLSGIDYLIKDNTHGIYVNTKSVAGIVAAIMELYTNPILYKEIKINLKQLKNCNLLNQSKNFFENVLDILNKEYRNEIH